jgi:hypothetical protein
MPLTEHEKEKAIRVIHGLSDEQLLDAALNVAETALFAPHIHAAPFSAVDLSPF